MPRGRVRARCVPGALMRSVCQKSLIAPLWGTFGVSALPDVPHRRAMGDIRLIAFAKYAAKRLLEALWQALGMMDSLGDCTAVRHRPNRRMSMGI